MTKYNETFSAAKVIALVSIVSAHTSFTISNESFELFMDRFGSMGVIVFFICSGYFFHLRSNEGFLFFLKRKTLSIFIPWLICGSFVYFEAKLVMGELIGLKAWACFLLGLNSYLYYMTMLIICYAVFYRVKRSSNMKAALCLSVLSIPSLLLTSFGFIDLAKIGLTNYLNIFNWLGYFGIGIIISQCDMKRILNVLKKCLSLTCVLWLFIFMIACQLDNATGYFSKFAIPLQLLSSMIIFGVANCRFLHRKFILHIERYSYFVYLVHLAFVPIVYKFLGDIHYINLVMPIVTILLIVGLARIGETIVCKVRIPMLEKVFYTVTGIRKERIQT